MYMTPELMVKPPLVFRPTSPHHQLRHLSNRNHALSHRLLKVLIPLCLVTLTIIIVSWRIHNIPTQLLPDQTLRHGYREERWKILHEALGLSIGDTHNISPTKSALHHGTPGILHGISRVDLYRRTSTSQIPPLHFTPDALEDNHVARGVSTSLEKIAASFRSIALAETDAEQRDKGGMRKAKRPSA